MGSARSGAGAEHRSRTERGVCEVTGRAEAVADGRSPGARGRVAGMLPVAAPWVFVTLWSTGFIGAKYGLPDAGPFTFLALRMQIAWVLLAGLAVVRRATLPVPRQIAHQAVAGLLLQAGYLGGVFAAIDRGMPAGLASLIVGLQPVLTAAGAQALLRERVTGRQWLGLALGLVGVALVVGERAVATGERPLGGVAFVAVAVALLSTTAGTLYQKRFGGGADLTVAAAIQYVAAGFVLLPLALEEGPELAWTLPFALALAWSVLALSVGAMLLLLALIRQHAVSRVAGLLYLVPPATAIEAYLLFGERLGPLALGGMVAVVAAVALVVRQPGRAPAG